jgi:hypothetical protein
MEKIVKDDHGCWVWTGARTRAGYGTLGVDGSTRYTHRLCYEEFVGPIPDGMRACHRCDNPPCCNPEHLFLGTDQDNMDDMWAKGRGRLVVKVTRIQVEAIQHRYAQGGVTQQELGAEYGLPQTTISQIVRGKVGHRLV